MINKIRRAEYFVILLYFTIFSVAFIASSIVYLLSLIQVENSPCPSHLILTNFSSSFSSSEPFDKPCSNFMLEWKCIAIAGLVYGIVCLAIAATVIGLVCTPRIYPPKTPLQINLNFSRVNHQTQDGGQRQLVENEMESETRFWSEMLCRKPIQKSFRSLVVLAFWLISFILPTFMAVRLVITDALRANKENENLHYQALAFFVVCITNLIILVVTCVSMCNDVEVDDQDQSQVCLGSEVGNCPRIVQDEEAEGKRPPVFLYSV